MKIDESVLRDDVRVIKEEAANYDARVCEETSKGYPETAAYYRGLAAGLRGAASAIESRVKLESATDPDRARDADPLADAPS